MKDNENNIQQNNNEIDEVLFEEQTKSYSIFTLSAIIIASIGLMIGAWYIYKSYQTKNYDEVVVISADQDETKELPLDPGGMVVNNIDKDVYNAIDKNYKNNEKVEVLLPPAEEPINKKELLLAEMSPVVKKMEEENSPAVPVSPTPPVAPVTPIDTAPTPKAEIVKPVVPEVTSPPVAEPKPEMKKPAMLEPKAVEENEEYIKPVTATESKKKPKFVKTPENFFKVQIASFRSVSDAEKEWKILSRKHPKILGNYQRYIVGKEIEGKGMFQRLQVGPFDSESAAKKACSQFKEAGMNCFVIKP